MTIEQAIASESPVLVDVYSDNCGPCRAMMPLINALEREGYPIAKVNVFENTDFGTKYKIEAIPTFLILKNGIEIKRLIGSQTKVALLAALDSN